MIMKIWHIKFPFSPNTIEEYIEDIKTSHFKDKSPEVAKFFILLGRGILK